MPTPMRVRATTGTVTLTSMCCLALTLTVASSDARDDATSGAAVVSVARAPVVGVADGILVGLTTGAVLRADDVLGESEYIALVPSVIRVGDRALEVSPFVLIDRNDLLSRLDRGRMQAATVHACALEDGVTWETADGGCKDLVTGLVWGIQYINWTYPDAEQVAADSTEGGFLDWRLPSRAELETVVAHDGAGHLDVVSAGYHWSTTRETGKSNWGIRLSDAGARTFQSGGAPFGLDHIHFMAVREAGAGGPFCGDGHCDPGEDCETCSDCDGKTNGPPSGRYCCGNGVQEGPEGDGRCDGNY